MTQESMDYVKRKLDLRNREEERLARKRLDTEYDFLFCNGELCAYGRTKKLVSIAQSVISRFEHMAGLIKSGDFFPDFDNFAFRKNRDPERHMIGNWHIDPFKSRGRSIVIPISEPVAHTLLNVGVGQPCPQYGVESLTCSINEPGSFTYFTHSMCHCEPRHDVARYVIVASFLWSDEPPPDEEMEALRDAFRLGM